MRRLALLLLLVVVACAWIVVRPKEPVSLRFALECGSVLRVAEVGDLNADGYMNLMFGLPADHRMEPEAGFARVVSPREERVLFQAFGESAGDRLGEIVAGLGDVDGDALPDFALGRCTGEKSFEIQVRSMKDGAIRFVLPATGAGADEVVVARAGDVDGDARGDVLVVDRPDERGRLTIYSGLDARVLLRLPATDDAPVCRLPAGPAGDVDADGVPDVFAYDTDAHALRLYSGRTGGELHALPGYFRRVVEASDVDHDGYADLVLTTQRASPEFPGETPQRRVVQVWSPRRSTVLAEFGEEELFGAFGSATAVIGDVDGDGFPELLVGAHDHDDGGAAKDYGKLFVFSIRDERLLWSESGREPHASLGSMVVALGDIDGDGRADFAATAWDQAPLYHVYRGRDIVR